MSELVPYQPPGLITQSAAIAAVPARRRRRRGCRQALSGILRRDDSQQEHPRRYYNDVRQFLAWCERQGIDGLKRIEPIHVALYVEELSHVFSKPTVKQHLAAVRMLFDWLVTGQVIRTNP